ncbi:MAG: hypothetical protein ABJA78_02285 [Ferruginibacter sp.]
MKEEWILYISEQHDNEPISDALVIPFLRSMEQGTVYEATFRSNPKMHCFKIAKRQEGWFSYSNYFVGVDWLVPGDAAVYVEPKLNKEKEQVDFLGMLIQSFEAPENLNELEGLFQVDYDKPWIAIPEQKDLLSPILIVQFLKLVQAIVRKGLKKSYYRVTENLNSRIKGKILVAQQIKANIVKNRLTKTICNYQEYGINTTENQFLKLVLEFVSSYLNQKGQFFSGDQSLQLRNILYYCLPAFERVDTLGQTHTVLDIKNNVFFREYKEAIRIGGYILKRFSFNINKTGQSQTSTPPFWIDMSKLFELYVFGKLKKLFPEPKAVTYHDRFLGNKETDILIKAAEKKCVVDCKYKPSYHNGSPSLEDKRQVVGYTRLKAIYDKLEIDYNKVIKALIIYSNQKCSDEIDKEKMFDDENKINEYIEFYKVGIKLPQLPPLQINSILIK